MEKWGKGYKIYSAKGRTMNTKQGRLCIELLALIGILCGMLTAYQEALCIILFNSCSSPVRKAQFSTREFETQIFSGSAFHFTAHKGQGRLFISWAVSISGPLFSPCWSIWVKIFPYLAGPSHF